MSFLTSGPLKIASSWQSIITSEFVIVHNLCEQMEEVCYNFKEACLFKDVFLKVLFDFWSEYNDWCTFR